MPPTSTARAKAAALSPGPERVSSSSPGPASCASAAASLAAPSAGGGEGGGGDGAASTAAAAVEARSAAAEWSSSETFDDRWGGLSDVDTFDSTDEAGTRTTGGPFYGFQRDADEFSRVWQDPSQSGDLVDVWDEEQRPRRRPRGAADGPPRLPPPR